MCLILSISIPRVLISQTHKRTRTGRCLNTGVRPRKPQLIRLETKQQAGGEHAFNLHVEG